MIAAFEAAWAFYGGVYRAVLVDNLKAIVQHADPTEPCINGVLLSFPGKTCCSTKFALQRMGGEELFVGDSAR